MASPKTKRALMALKPKDENNSCFECGALNPQWVSVSYGIWICLDCSGKHRGVGVHLSFVRSVTMDKWSEIELKKMEVGGNRKAKEFFDTQADWNWNAPLNVRYNSIAAARYREKINVESQGKTWTPGNIGNSSSDEDWGIKPQVEDREYPQSNQPIDPQPTSKPYTSIINTRKPTAKKGGLGGKRGLGAQKVAADFNKIEKDAQKADEETVPVFNQADTKPLTEEERAEQLKSMKEVYEDLSVKQKQTEEKMRMIDPKKAEHLERLGMGFKAVASSSTARGAKSHSAVSDMMTIEQVNPVREREPDHSNMHVSFSRTKEMERDLMLLELGLSSSSGKSSRDSPYGRSMNSWSDTKESMDEFWDTYERKANKPEIIESIPSLNDERPRASTKPKPSHQNASSKSPEPMGEAQKKFGNVKSISSEQYFGNSRESEFEQRASLNRFEGSKSISSDDYFNRNTNKNRNATSSALSSANFEDMKDSVREGVNKVAGKLSSMATDVFSSIQDKYGY